MHRITLRVPESLARQLEHAARVRRERVNAYSTAVLAAAVNPDLAGSETEALRERLSRAGLLADLSPVSVKRPSRATVAWARGEGPRSASQRVDLGRQAVSVFMDSSALVKLYADEPGHRAIRSLDQMIISCLVRVEVPAALWRKGRMGGLSPGAAATLTAEFAVDYHGEQGARPRFSSIAVISGILDHAAALVGTDRLRGYDAIQLASACAARRADAGCSRFACAGEGLRRAAAEDRFDSVP